ncbi:hypothetical protein JZ751_004224 [Albula glossodonta]|uniref:SH2 domain-containing protein n=1 Tax=Albula glossodonta TaxID=121402 RepID=A0A8T2N8J1_9TELE|nr:hypothetical protein JZ751_004224 [Albula glossodonta]
MNGHTIQQGTPEPSVRRFQSWREFCEFHALATARDLATQYRHFAREQQRQDVVSVDSFSKQFSDLFQEYFCSEVSRDDSSPPLPPHARGGWRIMSFSEVQGSNYAERRGPQTLLALLASKVDPLVSRIPLGRELPLECSSVDSDCPALPLFSSHSQEDETPDRGDIWGSTATDWYPHTAPLLPASPQTGASGVTHFSVAQIRRRARGLLRKCLQGSGRPAGQGGFKVRRGAMEPVEQVSISPPGHPSCQPQTRPPPASRWFEWLACRFGLQSNLPWVGPRDSCKEGLLKYLVVHDSMVDTRTDWQRCKLLLWRAQEGMGGEGYQLELFDPPKGFSPKLTARCSEISEIRRCNRLEMPDNRNTFVLKVSSWTAEINDCINIGPDSMDIELITSPLDDDMGCASRGRSESISQGSMSLGMSGQILRPMDHLLTPYPWFHGAISRVKAAQLVQTSGAEGHGAFLVRQSETRRGDYVLTFNFKGQAKHLRLTLTEWGQCRVQHLHFSSVLDMLSHYRLHPIPLECQSSDSPVVLVPFSLHRWSSEPSLAHTSPASLRHQAPPAGLSPISQPQLGSASPQGQPADALRRSASVGRRPLQLHPNLRPPQLDSNYELEPFSRGRQRAIDNQYMVL